MGEALGRAGVSIEGGGGFVHNGTGVAHFLFADGSVKPLSYLVDDFLLQSMSTLNGGEIISVEEDR